MKVKELRDYMNSIPIGRDNDPVIIQKDSEGNGYSPLSGVDENSFYSKNTP